LKAQHTKKLERLRYEGSNLIIRIIYDQRGC